MPPVSQPQARAMFAAASGHSTLGIPATVGREFIGGGVPQKRSASKSSKPTHRGRKPSSKPGASHLSALQQAHGAGDFKAAKTHALNYAKAVHQSASPAVEDMNMGTDNDTDDGSGVAPSPAPLAGAPAPVIPKPDPAGNARAMLAKLAMARKKQPK